MSTAVISEKSSSHKTIFILAGVLLLLVLGAAALFVLRSGQTALPEPAKPADDAKIVPAAALAGANDRLLVWQGGGAAPGKHSASNPGKLVLLDSSGQATPVIDVPQGASRVGPCGSQPLSSTGIYAFYMGGDTGTLYLMKGTDAPVKAAELNALACIGSGFQFSPDGSRFGYIAYEADATKSEFADGNLHIDNTADATELFKGENVVAFQLTKDGAAYISFFTNDKKEADEAAVTVWDGKAEKEVATLKPNDKCRFTSAQVAQTADGKLLAVMGHRCKSGDTRTSWQLYTIDPAAKSATMTANDFQAGQFASFARTNNLFFSPDGSYAYFTVPDGLANNTVGVKAVKLADMSISDLVAKNLVMPNYGGAANALPRFSPDGKWLAGVVTNGNNENTLTVVNVADPSVAPIQVKAGSKGDIISSLAFTPDSKQVIMVAGGADTADNSLIAVDLATGNDSRIARGHFGPGLTLSPDGKEAAVMAWQIPDDPKQPAYANTELINLESNEKATLFTGAEVKDGKVTNQQFALPLLWLQTGG
jgi:hypothetical protein